MQQSLKLLEKNYHLFEFDKSRNFTLKSMENLNKLVEEHILKLEVEIKEYIEMDKEVYELNDIRTKHHLAGTLLKKLNDIKITNEIYFVYKYQINYKSFSKFFAII